ncbi:MAG: 2-amino-4-hydroxy-6-hydroxymethyldihydropteridine diphosphokinase [Lentisphaerae bacterium]|nr:2-amino-4-hydroxy-6-hydroxymethyldihydropteridine diphosphokinase [Lentisphaerota bacterium]MCP4103059.1 2-amino-4-hydroxy-6-hydroxymethyldihydropteridine diphosphokinase [Lentisphaerota bacterium]
MYLKSYKIALALGGNIGNTAAFFESARKTLSAGGLQNIVCSSNYHTKPVNCPDGSADFVNAALTGVWHDSPEALHKLCQKIEINAGRPEEHGFNAPRTLDIDIIIFDDMQLNLPNLTVPHPRFHTRTFVLEPLAEIAPDWIAPGFDLTIAQLLAQLNSAN